METCKIDAGLNSPRSSSSPHPKSIRQHEFLENVTQSLEDKMTSLVYMQNYNGIFDLSSEEWEGSVFDEYAGKFDDVVNICPLGISFENWLAALAINIFELKMSNKKKLWELVVQKSKKFLKQTVGDDYEILLSKAKDWIHNKEVPTRIA